ncbi:MAG: trimethylamine methyltransferase family protein [Candidatus Thermoplasmatota archaeon]
MAKASMSVLSRDDREELHQAALRILGETGVIVESPTALGLLARAGARVDEGAMRAWLDERVVDEALRTAPKKVRICSRGGKDHTVPEDGVQLISTDGEPPAVLDLDRGVKRASTLKDLVDLVVVADALPEVDFVWPPVVATDMPSDRSSYFEFVATLANTSKHVQHGAASAEEARFQVEVCSAVLGSAEELRRRPIFSDVCTPISPLRYDRGEAEGLVELARAGIPVVHLSMGIAGSVSPVTVAGTLAIIAAENLCGITMSQAASPGAPCIYSSFSGVTDLRSGVFLCGTPEGILMDSAATEMAHHYGLPSCAGGPSNASRSLHAESGYQTAMTAMAAALAGSDLVVGLGGLDRAAMMSAEKLVMDCEAWRWLKRLRQGVAVDEERLGLDAIRRQGPGGTFLSDPHTLRHMRKDLLVPQVTAYHPMGQPDPTRDEMVGYAKARVKEILSKHRPEPLEPEAAGKVGGICRRHGIVRKDGSLIF